MLGCIFLQISQKDTLCENMSLLFTLVSNLNVKCNGLDHFTFHFKKCDKARPDIPTNCKVYNGTRSFEVKCTPGFDGGRKQTFTVEVTITNYSLLRI